MISVLLHFVLFVVHIESQFHNNNNQKKACFYYLTFIGHQNINEPLLSIKKYKFTRLLDFLSFLVNEIL